MHYNNGTYGDYSTAVIGNVSLGWISDVLEQDKGPFMAYIAGIAHPSEAHLTSAALQSKLLTFRQRSTQAKAPPPPSSCPVCSPQDGPGFPKAIPAPWYAGKYSQVRFPHPNRLWFECYSYLIWCVDYYYYYYYLVCGFEVKAPRTPNYNLSCPDHHWMIRQQATTAARCMLQSVS